jgi:transcriptional regulator with XRE-family HTH domain
LFKGKQLINKKIGQKIKLLRKSWGLSQIELAEKIGISFQQIQKYEKGATRISVMRLHQIAEALGVDINHFFDMGKKVFKVSDASLEYIDRGNDIDSFKPLDKDEITLLKLFRKIDNKKLKESVFKQLRAIAEIGKGK